MRSAGLVLISVMTAGCSLLFEVDDVPAREAGEPYEEPAADVLRTEISRDAGVDASVDGSIDSGVEADVASPLPERPCPPPIIQKKLGIVCP